MLDRPSLEYPLFQAVKAGKADIVELYLKKGAIGNVIYGHGTTAFHLTIEQNNLSIVKLFLNHPCDLSSKNALKVTTIALAAQLRFWDGVVTIAQARRDDSGVFQYSSALIDATAANHMQAVKALLMAGANTNGYVLHNAVANQNPEMITLLLQYGADPEVKNKDGTPIGIAARKTYWNCVMAFAKTKSDKYDKYEYGYALLIATQENKISVVKALLEAKTSTAWSMNGYTPLHNAVAVNNPNMVALLVLYNANKNAVNAKQEIPLNMASALQRWDCVKAILAPEKYYNLNTQLVLFYLFAANRNVHNRFSLLTGDVLQLILNLAFEQQYNYQSAYKEYVTLRDKRQFVARSAKFVTEYSQFGLLRRMVGIQSDVSFQFVSEVEKIVNSRQPIEKRQAQIQEKIETFTKNKGEEVSRAVKLLTDNHLFKPKQTGTSEIDTKKQQLKC